MENITNALNIELVVELLKKNGIHRLVISPGGTNIPLVKAVQDDPFFTCYSVVDERSALYFAIGLYLQTGDVIALSCTSAQATRNYIPGLTEAYYKKVPILAITMMKHPRNVYQDYMQAPDQTSLPNDAVKKSYELPFVSDQNDVLHSMRLINEAILELSHDGYGPVQLCIPWLDFPQEYRNLPPKNIVRYSNYEDNWSNLSLENKKILIVVGEHRPFAEKLSGLIKNFASCYDVVVYTNHLSNFSCEYSLDANLLLSTINAEEFYEKIAPDIIISIGGQTGDYPLYKILSKESETEIEHWRVHPDGKVVDTYDKLKRVFQCSESYFFEYFIGLKNSESTAHQYLNNWKVLMEDLSTDIDLPYSNAYAAQKLHRRLPNNSYVQFAILNSLRVWDLFSLDSSITCYSNVGAFGIDGGMSTLIGISMETNDLCFMIIGDLSFFYDMNSLGIRHIKNNIRILLVNNNGGVEFKLGGRNNSSTDRYIAAANHFSSAKGWSETCGFQYIFAENKKEFQDSIDTFVGDSDKPIVLEMKVTDVDDAEAYKKIIESNTKYDMKDTLKRGIKSLIRGH